MQLGIARFSSNAVKNYPSERITLTDSECDSVHVYILSKFQVLNGNGFGSFRMLCYAVPLQKCSLHSQI